MTINWDRVPSSILVCEQGGRIKLVNASFVQNIMDFPSLTSLLLWDVVLDEDVAQLRTALAAATQDGGLQVVVFDVLLFQRNGVFPQLRSCEAHVQADGDDFVLSMLLSPVKKQKAMAMQIKEALDYLVHSPAPLQLVSPSGHILWANKALLNLLEYTPQEYIGKHVQVFATAAQRADIKAQGWQPQLALQYSSDLLYTKKSGERVAVPVDATLHVDRHFKQRNSAR
jgi:PAS domain-containing protein